jgi:hypothetical protein
MLVACVGGDDSTTTDAGNTDTGTQQDVGANDVTTQDVAVDSPLVCDGGSTVMACNGSCVDVASSGTSCGKCGHDCGGAPCTAGACQPGIVADTLTYPVFDVDATNVYFNKGTQSELDLESCPSSGCKLQPMKLATPGNIETADIGGWMQLMGTNIAFLGEASVQVGRWRVFACDQVNGCGNTPVTIANAGLQSLGTDFVTTGNDVYFTNYKYISHANCSAGNTCSTTENLIVSGTVWPHIAMSADSAGVYYVDPTTHVLERCGTSGTCTPTAMSNAFSTTVKSTFTYGNMIWILDSQMSGYAKGTISTCANAGFCTTPTVFINNQHYPTLFRVDADGAFWYDADTQDITMCPLSGCKPSTTTLVTNVPIVTSLRTDAKFVYWATDTQILRVAKP